MWARVATFEGGDLERLRADAERRITDDALPGGAASAMVLADKEQNRRLFVTMFDSREALDKAEAVFEQMGDEVPEEIRGRRTSVDYYEVAFQR